MNIFSKEYTCLILPILIDSSFSWGVRIKFCITYKTVHWIRHSEIFASFFLEEIVEINCSLIYDFYFEYAHK